MSAASLGLAALGPARLLAQEAGLRPMTGDVVPIAREEYQARIGKARRLMAEHGIGALLIEPGASMTYFTGVQWWRSERLTAIVLPREGEVAVVTPHFEEPSVRESLKVAAEIRVWNEHEDPSAGRRHPARPSGDAPVGIEETVRFFAVDGLRRAMPASASSRRAGGAAAAVIKSAHEIALSRRRPTSPSPPSPHRAQDRASHDSRDIARS